MKNAKVTGVSGLVLRATVAGVLAGVAMLGSGCSSEKDKAAHERNGCGGPNGCGGKEGDKNGCQGHNGCQGAEKGAGKSASKPAEK